MKIEKFVLLALGLCIVFRVNEAFAQPAPIYSDSFSYKKGTDDQVANSINVYLSDEIKLSPFDVPG